MMADYFGKGQDRASSSRTSTGRRRFTEGPRESDRKRSRSRSRERSTKNRSRSRERPRRSRSREDYSSRSRSPPESEGSHRRRLVVESRQKDCKEDGRRKFTEEVPHKEISPSLLCQPINLSSHSSSTTPSAPQPIKLELSQQEKSKSESAPHLKKPSHTVSSVFNADESDDEEMPPEAKMRMKNKGKFTPTATGPNSFGKGSMGFVDRRGLMRKEMERCWEQTRKEDEIAKQSFKH